MSNENSVSGELKYVSPAGRKFTALLRPAKQKSPERIIEVARLGRIVTLLPEAQAKRSATQKVNTQAVWDWNPSDHPKLVTSDVYSAQIKPRLISLSCSLVGKRLGVSVGYADQIRKGRVLHPRLWQALAKIAGVSE